MKAIIFTNENGNVSVCIPTGELSIEEVQAKDCPTDSIIVDMSELPSEDDFFNGWELSNGKVSVNFLKAIEITKNRLRLERMPLLAAQDVLFQKALEMNADTSLIVAEKNRLRDITKQADLAKTLDDLRVIQVK